MSAKHAVLGLLLEGPAYPYELRDRLKHRLGPAWEVDTGHLSRIIAGLERDGFVERVDHVASASPRRHFYAITERGEEELAHWLDTDLEGVKLPRRPLLVQLTLGGQQRLESEALTKIGAYESACTFVQNELARLMREIPPDGPLVRADHLLLRVNLSADLAHIEGELGWARQARRTISWLLTQRAVWPRDTGLAG